MYGYDFRTAVQGYLDLVKTWIQLKLIVCVKKMINRNLIWWKQSFTKAILCNCIGH